MAQHVKKEKEKKANLQIKQRFLRGKKTALLFQRVFYIKKKKMHLLCPCQIIRRLTN